MPGHSHVKFERARYGIQTIKTEPVSIEDEVDDVLDGLNVPRQENLVNKWHDFLEILKETLSKKCSKNFQKALIVWLESVSWECEVQPNCMFMEKC